MDYERLSSILAALGFDYNVNQIEVLYKQERSKFYEIRDICDEFKRKLKKSTVIGNVYLRGVDGKLTALTEHPNIEVNKIRPMSTDTLDKCVYCCDDQSVPLLSKWKELFNKPIILCLDDDDVFTEEDKENILKK